MEANHSNQRPTLRAPRPNKPSKGKKVFTGHERQLNDYVKNETPVTVHSNMFPDGKVKAVIRRFDPYTVTVDIDSGAKNALIFKHAIIAIIEAKEA